MLNPLGKLPHRLRVHDDILDGGEERFSRLHWPGASCYLGLPSMAGFTCHSEGHRGGLPSLRKAKGLVEARKTQKICRRADCFELEEAPFYRNFLKSC